jgi:hypothetical protein
LKKSTRKPLTKQRRQKLALDAFRLDQRSKV